MNIKLNEFLNVDELFNCLNYFDNYFMPSLSTRVIDLKAYAKKLIDNANNYYLSDENNDILGFISFYCNDNITNIAYLTLIATNKNYKKMGVASKLLESCIEICKENNMQQLKLEVQKNNNIAMDFYKKRGFNICDENELSFFMIKNI